jgi:hypothetical protein
MRKSVVHSLDELLDCLRLIARGLKSGFKFERRVFRCVFH